MMSNRMIQRSRPFAIAVPEFSSTGVGRRRVAKFDTNFRKHLPAKAAKEGEGAAGSAPPPPPDSGPGGGDECRKPESERVGRAGSPAPGFVPPPGGDGEWRWTPEFLRRSAWRGAPYGALSVGLNFGKAPPSGTARDQRLALRAGPRGWEPSNRPSRSSS